MFRRLILASLVVLFAASPSLATVTVTELTAGGIGTNSLTGTTASVSPTSGSLLLLFFTNRATDPGGGACSLSSVTGQGLTWTNVTTVSIVGGVFKHELYRAVSDGTAGAITITYVTNPCNSIAWSLLQLTGVNTTTNQGVVTSSTNNNASCNNCTLTQAWAAYTNADNTQVTGCAVGDQGSPSIVFTINGDPGWAEGALTTVGSGNPFRAIIEQWLIVRGSNTTARCIWSSMGGLSHASIITAEIAAATGTVKHKVTE